MIAILLVDDHGMVREGFRQMLEADGEFDIVAEANSGEEGYRKYFQLKPDIVILDLSLPGEGGLATLRRMNSRDENAKVLVLSMYDDAAIVVRALDCGAKGFLSKSASQQELKEAVIAVSNGKPYIEKRLHDKVHARPLKDQNPLEALTTREFEVFTMLAEGRSVKEIASLLHLSSKTVGAHRTSSMKKLQLKNSAEIVRVAVLWNVVKI